jgi:hypothetical protein
MENSRGILRLIAFSLIGFAHWFFSNLYEAVVFSPNILFASSKVAILENVRELFHISAPYYYFLPWSPVSILLVIILYIKIQSKGVSNLKKWVRAAMLLAIATGGLTFVIITKYNLSLWVGTRKLSEAEIKEMVIDSLILGNLRLVMVASILYCLNRSLLIILLQRESYEIKQF